MNAIVEFSSEMREGNFSDEVVVPLKYISKIEQLKSKELYRWIYSLLLEITKRMSSGNLDRVVGLIHNITFEYWLYDGISMDDRRICNELYYELLAEYDRLFDDFLPSQVRKRKDQILKKTPK